MPRACASPGAARGLRSAAGRSRGKPEAPRPSAAPDGQQRGSAEERAWLPRADSAVGSPWRPVGRSGSARASTAHRSGRRARGWALGVGPSRSSALRPVRSRAPTGRPSCAARRQRMLHGAAPPGALGSPVLSGTAVQLPWAGRRGEPGGTLPGQRGLSPEPRRRVGCGVWGRATGFRPDAGADLGSLSALTCSPRPLRRDSAAPGLRAPARTC